MDREAGSYVIDEKGNLKPNLDDEAMVERHSQIINVHIYGNVVDHDAFVEEMKKTKKTIKEKEEENVHNE